MLYYVILALGTIVLLSPILYKWYFYITYHTVQQKERERVRETFKDKPMSMGESFLEHYSAYEDKTEESFLRLGLWAQNFGYFYLSFVIWRNTGEWFFQPLCLIVTATLNICFLIRGDSASYYLKQHLQDVVIWANVLSFLCLIYNPLFGITQLYWVVFWVGIALLYIKYPPYSLKRDRTAFVFNLLKKGINTPPEEWSQIKNRLNGRELSRLRNGMYEYKLGKDIEINEYKDMLTEELMERHGIQSLPIVDYCHENRDTVVLFYICKVPVSKAAEIIYKDQFDK